MEDEARGASLVAINAQSVAALARSQWVRWRSVAVRSYSVGGHLFPIEDTARRIATLRATTEAREGLSAFLDKRRPVWTDT